MADVSRWVSMALIEVEARVPHGVVLSAPWPCLLDGIVAGVVRRRRLGRGFGVVRDHHVDVLPLAMWPRNSRDAKRWVWMASAGVPVDHRGVEVRWWHKRFDHQAAEAVVGASLPKNVLEAGGRWKAWRMPQPTTVCTTVRWRAVGVADEVAGLLADVHAIGDGRAQGQGEVSEWFVRPVAPVVCPQSAGALEAMRWLLSDGFSRPVPARHADLLGLGADAETVPGVYRPPYWRAPQSPTHTGRREMQDVIAPWIIDQLGEEVTHV